MRGSDQRAGSLFSYVDLEARVPSRHPLRLIRAIVNEALEALSGDFSKLYSRIGRPSIPPERLLRALLLQAFYSIRSERQLMERLEYDLLFRWFVGIGVDDRAWDHSTFSKTRHGRFRDSAYGSAAMLGWLVHERGIEPHIPVFDKSERRDGTFERAAVIVLVQPIDEGRNVGVAPHPGRKAAEGPPRLR